MPEYEQWKESTSMSGWDIKYYKGLGTSTREEAKEYFADIEEHRKTFTWASRASKLANTVMNAHDACALQIVQHGQTGQKAQIWEVS